MDDTKISFDGEINFMLSAKHVLSCAEVGGYPAKQIDSAGWRVRSGPNPSKAGYLC